MRKRPHIVSSIVVGGMLFFAILDLPYSYYQALRFVVAAAALLVVWIAHEEEQVAYAWSFGAIAVLFNPLIPVHLSKDTWRIIDFGVGIAFLYAAIKLVRAAPKSHTA